MTVSYGGFVLLLYKPGSYCKTTISSEEQPFLSSISLAGSPIEIVPKHFLGGSTIEGSCHIRAQPSETLARQSRRPPAVSSRWPFLLSTTSPRLLFMPSKQIRSSHSLQPQIFLHRSQNVASPTCQSPVEGRCDWVQDFILIFNT